MAIPSCIIGVFRPSFYHVCDRRKIVGQNVVVVCVRTWGENERARNQHLPGILRLKQHSPTSPYFVGSCHACAIKHQIQAHFDTNPTELDTKSQQTQRTATNSENIEEYGQNRVGVLVQT